MELTILELLQPENIITSLSAPDAKTTIQQLSANLVGSGVVVEGFADDVWRREQLFPTGLPTHPHGVAIPHADPDHVLNSAIAIGILTKPVIFDQMASDHKEKIEAWIIFLLAVNEKEKQISLLQEIIDLVKIPGFIERLLSATSSEEIVSYIIDTCN
jgi:PTS system galactitol-specific IIA component